MPTMAMIERPSSDTTKVSGEDIYITNNITNTPKIEFMGIDLGTFA